MRSILLYCLIILYNITPLSAAASKDLIQVGAYRYTYKYLFKLYDAQLFAEARSSPEQIISGSCAYSLQFDYLRSISRETIIHSAAHMLSKNLSAAQLQQIRKRIAAINTVYTDVTAGDRYSFNYDPERGTTVLLNDQALITIAGADFARLYSTIWFGSHPISTEMRDTLLGRNP